MVDSSTLPHVEPPPVREPRGEPDAGKRQNPQNGNGHSPAAEVAPLDKAVSRPRQSLPRAKTFSGLTRADHVVLAVLCAIALSLMVWHWVRLSGWGMRPVEIDRLPHNAADFRIDINTATWVEWVQLDGIGETLAARIVADREANGPFQSVDDLRRVKGIGPKTLERIRPYLAVRKPGVKE